MIIKENNSIALNFNYFMVIRGPGESCYKVFLFFVCYLHTLKEINTGDRCIKSYWKSSMAIQLKKKWERKIT